MITREAKEANDLFYTCSLIEYIARLQKQKRSTVVSTLGKARVQKILDLADVYHSDNIERVAHDFIEESGLKIGNYDNVAQAKYNIPTCFDIGKIMKRLILLVANERTCDIVDALMDVYNSFIIEKIDDYNSSFYYENPSYIFETYKANHLDEDDTE